MPKDDPEQYERAMAEIRLWTSWIESYQKGGQ